MPRSRTSTRHPVAMGPSLPERISFLLLLAAILLVHYALDPYFHQLNELDGSYQYALTRLWMDGRLFGVDTFLTYGPLAQHLGPIIGIGQAPPPSGLFFKGLFMALFLYCVWDLTGRLPVPGRAVRWALALGGAVWLSLHPILRFEKDGFYDTLIFLAYLGLHFHPAGTGPRNPYLWVLGILSVTLTHFKFSLGLHATAPLVITCLAHLAYGKGWRFPVTIGTAWWAGNTLVFLLLSGHWDFLGSLGPSLFFSSIYSELMISHDTPGAGAVLIYPLAFLACLSFLGLGLLLGSLKGMDRVTLVSWGACLGSTAFYLFKHGFVRADIHAFWFYQTLVPLTVLLGVLLLPLVLIRRRESWVALAFLSTSLLVWHQHLTLADPDGDSLRQLQGAISKRWVQVPDRTWMYLRDPEDVTRAFQEARTTLLRIAYPDLLKALERLEKEGPGRTISFAPWNLMLACQVPGLKLLPLPSLHTYNGAGLATMGERDAKLLASTTGPDILVIGDHALDDRNPLSEYSHWLPSLLVHYRHQGTFNGNLILVRCPPRADRDIRVTPTGPSPFLKLTAPRLGPFQEACFKLARVLFKSPELWVLVEGKDIRGKSRRMRYRAFYSQLREGVYFQTGSLEEVLGDRPTSAPGGTCLSSVETAVVLRKAGFPNLPVFPTVLPLSVEFCAPRNYRCGTLKGP